MAESAALLVEDILPEAPMRQWVLSFPFQLRFLFASRPAIMGEALGIVYRVIATHLIKKAGLTHKTAHTGAVTLIKRFGSALNLNIHFHSIANYSFVLHSEFSHSLGQPSASPQRIAALTSFCCAPYAPV
jgi:hypothetical protein